MARVERKQYTFRYSVPEVKLMGADNVALGAQTEELALHRVEIVTSVNRHGQYLVERLFEQAARSGAVRRRVFEPVGDPDIGHACRAKLSPEILPYAAASNTV